MKTKNLIIASLAVVGVVAAGSASAFQISGIIDCNHADCNGHDYAGGGNMFLGISTQDHVIPTHKQQTYFDKKFTGSGSWYQTETASLGSSNTQYVSIEANDAFVYDYIHDYKVSFYGEVDKSCHLMKLTPFSTVKVFAYPDAATPYIMCYVMQ